MSVNVLKRTSRLPEEYQEVEYIQGTGTQYIDTGVKLSNTDIIKCKFAITSLPDNTRGIYGLGDAGVGFFNLLIRNPITARVGGGSNQVTSTNVVFDHIYNTSLTSGVYVEDGITYTFTGGNCDETKNCYVFARNHPPYNIPTPSKVYSFEIVGKFNGIPCYRKADGVIGMFNTVSETFFTNAGTGTFTKGADVGGSGFEATRTKAVIFNSSTPQRVKMAMLQSNIPSAYQEVEYIESTGTQYIDTGFSVNSNSCLEIEGYFSYISGQTRAGARIGVKNSAFNFMSVTGNYMRIDYGSQQITDQNKDMVYLKLDGKNSSIDILYADNTQSSISLQQETFSTQLNYYLFALNNNGQAQYSSERIDACKLYDDGLLVRNFVPCYRKSDNEIGLYDLVNGVFYTNAGTGDFTKGADVVSFEIIKI